MNQTIYHYFMLCVIFGVIFSLDESGKDELENLPTELDPISYLFNKIKKLEEKDVETKKLIEEKDYEIKKMIEERDETAKSQASQVEDLSARFENFEGKAHMELV